MKRWRTKLLLAGGTAAILVAIPALSQETPESLLPPGFGETTPPPANEQAPAAPGAPTPSAPATPSTSPLLPPDSGDVPTLEELQAMLEALPPPIEVPAGSRRPVDVAGPLGPQGWGMAPDAFGNGNGRFLSSLMRRLDAPIPSRWTHIVLRRALLSRVPAPSFVHPVDWIAERAWLLLRMGEADGARMLVQGVDVDQFTPKMFSIAVQTALATADPAGLCPLVEPGRKTSDEPVWPLADAMCSGIRGDASQASLLIDQARRRGRVGGIDITLAEKIVGSGENTRRAVSVQWEDVDEINIWRFGLASATGLEIPPRLMNAAGAHVRAWQARAAMLPIEQRLDAAQYAASLGVFSNASLVEMYSLMADETDPGDFAASIGGRLRRAYVGRTIGDRMAAMRSLWGDGTGPVNQHARRILTATAATRVAPSEELQGDAVNLIASMLTAGYDVQAARWSDVVGNMDGEAGDRAWSMLAVASPQPSVDISARRVEAFRASDESPGDFRTQMLVAAVAGVGRLGEDTAAGLAEDMGVNLLAQNSWTQMLERAVQRRQPATVALLAGIGMQTPGWRGVPPAHLYRILSALRRVGLGYEARMIAAEAMARL
jgi:hypothetical protein